MFNIADGGFTELHTLWLNEEKVRESLLLMVLPHFYCKFLFKLISSLYYISVKVSCFSRVQRPPTHADHALAWSSTHHTMFNLFRGHLRFFGHILCQGRPRPHRTVTFCGGFLVVCESGFRYKEFQLSMHDTVMPCLAIGLIVGI